MLELMKIKEFFNKYFCEGQKLRERKSSNTSVESTDDDQTLLYPIKRWIKKNPKFVGPLIPFIFFHILWWTWMGVNDKFYYFNQKAGSEEAPRYLMSVTMVFGSMIAGATSEGGASIAFPVMVFVFGIAPAIARDFSFMIQSCGMTAAAFAIWWMKVEVEMKSLLYCTIGGTIGIIFGLEEVAPRLPPPFSKMYFVSIWFAFAFSLYFLNRFHDRHVYNLIPYWEKGVIYTFNLFNYTIYINWKAIVLIIFGFFGGICSAIAGSGIDICSFASLTLLFRVTEKTATPTSVILMAINTCVGFFWREFMMGGVESESWKYLWVCMPIVVLGAPLGSVVGSHFHRLVLAAFVYVTDTVQLIGALIIVEPWSNKSTGKPLLLSLTSLCMIVFGGLFFRFLAYRGNKIMVTNEVDNNEKDITMIEVKPKKKYEIVKKEIDDNDDIDDEKLNDPIEV